MVNKNLHCSSLSAQVNSECKHNFIQNIISSCNISASDPNFKVNLLCMHQKHDETIDEARCCTIWSWTDDLWSLIPVAGISRRIWSSLCLAFEYTWDVLAELSTDVEAICCLWPEAPSSNDCASPLIFDSTSRSSLAPFVLESPPYNEK